MTCDRAIRHRVRRSPPARGRKSWPHVLSPRGEVSVAIRSETEGRLGRGAHGAGGDFLEVEARRLAGWEINVNVVAVRVPDVDLHVAQSLHTPRVIAHAVAFQATHELLEAGGAEGEVLESQAGGLG